MTHNWYIVHLLVYHRLDTASPLGLECRNIPEELCIRLELVPLACDKCGLRTKRMTVTSTIETFDQPYRMSYSNVPLTKHDLTSL